MIKIPASTPVLYSSEKTPDPFVHAIIGHPRLSWFWLITEYNPEERLLFGFVLGDFPEFGYFSLDELQTTGCVNLPHSEPVRLSKVRARLEKDEGEG
jgi:hypothetical protein